jgi:hypothetical protein
VPYLFKCATARSRCLGILVYCLNAMPHLYAVRCSSHGACSCGGRRRGANQRCSPCTVTQRRGAKARDSNASSAEARNGRTESRLVKCSSVMNLTLRPLRSVVTQHCIISTGKGYCVLLTLHNLLLLCVLHMSLICL